MEALFSDYEEVRKSGLFDAEYYLVTYPDVVERNVDPLVHYLEEGAREGRNPNLDFDAGFYLEQCQRRGEQPSNPLLHYLRIGAARGFKTRREAADGEPRKPTDQVGKLPILVAIEMLGVTDMSDGTSRLSISGWALAAAPIGEITVSVGDEILGTATYGLARPDVVRLYPDRTPAARCGFILAFGLPRRMSGARSPLLTVRAGNGEVGQHPLQLDIPRDGKSVGSQHPVTLRVAQPAGDRDLQLHIDGPRLVGGAAAAPVRGNLEIGGWALAKAGVAAVAISIDGTPVATADYGLRRLDIEAAFTDRADALTSGYQVLLPHRVLPKGAHRVTVSLRDKAGGTTSTEFG